MCTSTTYQKIVLPCAKIKNHDRILEIKTQWKSIFPHQSKELQNCRSIRGIQINQRRVERNKRNLKIIRFREGVEKI